MMKRKNNLKEALEKDGIADKDDVRIYEYTRFEKWVTQIDRAW